MLLFMALTAHRRPRSGPWSLPFCTSQALFFSTPCPPLAPHMHAHTFSFLILSPKKL